MIVPVILAGGSGTRLWPLSRELYPKQLLSLIGQYSLLQNTMRRLHDVPDIGRPIVVCYAEHRFMVAEQLREIDEKAIILTEPLCRDTAPAIAVAALQAIAQESDPDAVLLVLPTDHVIKSLQAFGLGVKAAVAQAQAGFLATFGIRPEYPETGYGYIERGTKLPGADEIYLVKRFVEKPELKKAAAYVKSGGFYWNSGIFAFKAGIFLEELGKFEPQMLAACQKTFASSTIDLDFVRLSKDEFAESPSNSVDYAVMEKTEKLRVIPLECGWSDIGSWSALWRLEAKDGCGNVIKGDIVVDDLRDSYIYASNRLVAAIGLERVVIVETADAVLVADMDKVQQVKVVVKQLKDKKSCAVSQHRKVSRHWGSYECVVSDDRFRVNRLVVNPGASLSSQMQHHCAGHWTVIKGTVKVTNGDKAIILSENQSTCMPIGQPHRLENPGKTTLEIIEVWSGSSLGEDDITRFDDAFGVHNTEIFGVIKQAP